jgi:hypothetical protein
MLRENMRYFLFGRSRKAIDVRLVLNVAKAQGIGMATGPRCTHNGLLLAPPAWSNIVAFDLGQNAGVASFRCAHSRAVRTNLPVCRIPGMCGLMPQE